MAVERHTAVTIDDRRTVAVAASWQWYNAWYLTNTQGGRLRLTRPLDRLEQSVDSGHHMPSHHQPALTGERHVPLLVVHHGIAALVLHYLAVVDQTDDQHVAARLGLP